MPRYDGGTRRQAGFIDLSPCASPLNPFSRPALGRFEERLRHFQTQTHHPKALADLLPDGFIWTPFRPDLDQAILEPRYTFPKRWQICFQMASFGHLSVQIWIKPFSNPDTPSQSHCRFASRWLHVDAFLSDPDQTIFESGDASPKPYRFSSRWLHSDTLLSRSGSSHFQTRIHLICRDLSLSNILEPCNSV